MMRFRGGGVGHKSTRQATDFFKNDRHNSDLQDRLERRTDIIEENEEINDWEESEGVGNSTEVDVADEEDDYGYRLGEDHSDAASEEEKGEDEDESELGDEDFGPEDDGRAVDSDSL